jgi:hypothetical protein
MIRLLFVSLILAAVGCQSQPTVEQIEANGFGRPTYSSENVFYDKPWSDKDQPWVR